LKKGDIINELSKATKLGFTSLKRIINQGIKAPKPTKDRPNKYTFDSFDKNIIKQIINQFYANKTLPYINDVYSKIKENENLNFKDCSLSTFYRIMRKMGFKLAKVGEISRKILMEKTDNVLKRRNYLREKKRLEENPELLWVYLDETYVHKNLVNNEIIVCNSELPNVKIPIGKGLRFSIIHAGSEEGFVKDAELIHVNKELNSDSFENWLKFKLLPKLPKKSVIVLDNAKTHSKHFSDIPTQKSKKQEIIDWLTLKNIPIPEKALKIELLNLVKKNKPENIYTVDKIIRDAGHIAIRLPPYHCHLNPIELVWAQIKKFIAKRNLNNNKEQIYDLIFKSFDEITPEFWQKCIRHCKDIELEYWETDGIIDSSIENLVIELGEESDSDEYDSDISFTDY
jgi:transposase